MVKTGQKEQYTETSLEHIYMVDYCPRLLILLDHLITLALKKRYGDSIKLIELNDDIEMYAHKKAVNRKY